MQNLNIVQNDEECKEVKIHFSLEKVAYEANYKTYVKVLIEKKIPFLTRYEGKKNV